MKRRLLNLLTVLSLLLCVAVAVLWVRGYRLQEYVAFSSGGHSPAVGNYPGGIFLAWNLNTRTAPGFSYLGYRYGDDPRRGAHRFGPFAYRNDRIPAASAVQPTVVIRAVMFPTWFPLSLFAILFCWALRRSLLSRRRKPGLCSRCGYDLRATPERCPECGTMSSEPT
jgi:hypothetical protein